MCPKIIEKFENDLFMAHARTSVHQTIVHCATGETKAPTLREIFDVPSVNLQTLDIQRFHSFIYYAVLSVEGPTFTISRVNRLHMGAYLCIASNGVPPSVSKRVTLIVHCKWKIFFFLLFSKACHVCETNHETIRFILHFPHCSSANDLRSSE